MEEISFFRYKALLCQQQQLTSDFSNEAEGLLHYVVKGFSVYNLFQVVLVLQRSM